MKSYAFFFLSIIWATLRLDAQTCPGAPLTLSTQSQVNNFPTNYPGCTEVGVSITISGSNITNLNGLSQLQSITKSLFILNCPALTSLSGLSNLTNISVELTIDNCDALTTLNGLQNLPFIGGSLTISGNALLNNISALSGIDYINGVLQITQNPALTNLTGLENVTFTGRYLQINGNNGLTSIGSLSSLTQVGNNVNTNGRYLVITSNPSLTTINGLNSLQSVGTYFDVSNNGNLTTLNAFSNLETVGGDMSITGNAKLTSILDFDNLSSVGGTLTISNNNLLTDCEAQGICDYLDGPGPAVIANNDPGCNSVAQVEAACLLLPVKLTRFQANNRPEGVILEWQTASEEQNNYFQVEHSTNGVNYAAIGEVKGSGTTAETKHYRFTHRNPSNGINYYRLKQVDYDGKFEYSKIAVAVVEQEEAVNVFPNPTDGPVFINNTSDESSARVTDFTGREIFKDLLPENGMLDLSGQPQGVYLIEIANGNSKTVKRIVKK